MAETQEVVAAKKTVQRRCKYCKGTFAAREADVKRGWAKFCSKSCKAKEQTRRTGHAGPTGLYYAPSHGQDGEL